MASNKGGEEHQNFEKPILRSMNIGKEQKKDEPKAGTSGGKGGGQKKDDIVVLETEHTKDFTIGRVPDFPWQSTVESGDLGEILKNRNVSLVAYVSF